MAFPIEKLQVPEKAALPPVATDRFLAGMRLFAAGCTVIAARHQSDYAGLTATALCSVTAEPPQLLVCINRKVRARSMAAQAGTLSVNLLSRSQEMTARRFAGMVEGIRAADRFVDADWQTSLTGAPVLKDALANFVCNIADIIEASTHSIFLCDVVDIVVSTAGSAEPLLYFNGRFTSAA
jgi:flavin reductase (NADH)/flavin reductase